MAEARKQPYMFRCYTKPTFSVEPGVIRLYQTIRAGRTGTHAVFCYDLCVEALMSQSGTP